ncbi:MAG: ATP-dependent metallopeptidase FtsH/Yme1/Tma family protein, partial [Deltaproteobacteria bacterium]|nr:ATP-dependent metallopeptidase FtsH/Yme1/Tma family protein [Deltaproteobacteria bacterium]
MPPKKKKKPQEEMIDKARSIFGPQASKGKKGALPPRAHFSIWYFLIAFLLITYAQQYFFAGKVETIPYSQFKRYLTQGTLSKLTIGEKNIRGTLKGKGTMPGQDQEFITIRVDDPDLVKDLDEHEVTY